LKEKNFFLTTKMRRRRVRGERGKSTH